MDGELTYRQLEAIFTEYFNLGAIASDINTKFALISLICFSVHFQRCHGSSGKQKNSITLKEAFLSFQKFLYSAINLIPPVRRHFSMDHCQRRRLIHRPPYNYFINFFLV